MMHGVTPAREFLITFASRPHCSASLNHEYNSWSVYVFDIMHTGHKVTFDVITLVKVCHKNECKPIRLIFVYLPLLLLIATITIIN